jgi:hypothetical protein
MAHRSFVGTAGYRVNMRSDGPAAPPTAEVVAGIAAFAAELAARPAPDSGAACYEQAETLGRAVDLLESAIAARVAVATRSGQVAEWGHTSPAAWLRTSLGMRHARAGERAVLADQLPRLPQVAKRLAAGELSSGYAAAIADGVRRLDETDCAKAERLLLGLVDDGHSVGQLIRFADRIKDLIAERDGTATEPEDGRRGERQWWAMHRSGSGAFVKGRFGAELMALIQARLGPLARPCGAEDPRDYSERLADALQTYLSGADSTGADSRWDPILVIDIKQSAMPEPGVPEPPVRETDEMPPDTGGPAPHPAGAPAAVSDVEPERTASTRPARAPDRAGRPRAMGATRDKADGDGARRRRPSCDRPDGAGGRDWQPAGHTGPGSRPAAGAGVAPRSTSGTHQAPRPDTSPPGRHDLGLARGQAHGPVADRGRAGPPGQGGSPSGRQPPERTTPESAPRIPHPPDAPRRGSPPSAGRPSKPPAPGWSFNDARLTGRLADGTPVPAERVRTILLNAGFSALVLGTDGLPLYLGRRVRCASPAQRRVLVTRYVTCVVEGCEIPAIACQIDHVDNWAAGQPTDIDLLVPCCAFHNRYKERHPDRVTIHQDADGRYRYQIARPGSGPGSRNGAGRQRRDAQGQRRNGRPATGRDP